MRIAFYTLGCKTNQYETQAMEQLLEKAGCEIGSFEEKNDAYVINTCSVTAIADKKNRAMIRRCRRSTLAPSSACAAAIPSMTRRLSGRWGWMCWAVPADGRCSWRI